MKNHDLLSQWLEESPENRRAFQEESLILEATEAILEAMEIRGVTKVALAEHLGSSKAHVSQLLSGSRNMTLRTFARIAFSLDMAPSLGLKDLAPLDKPVWESEQVSVQTSLSWDSGTIERRPRRDDVPAVLVNRSSADWTSSGQYAGPA